MPELSNNNENVSNVLIHEIGKESKIVVKNSNEIGGSDFFYSQYQYAASIVKNLYSTQEEDNQLENTNNIIAFIGERGSGKTSCMLTFANCLVKGKVGQFLKEKEHQNKFDDKTFYLLPAIDPSFFDRNYNILGAVIASVYQNFKEVEKNRSTPISEGIKRDFYKALTKAQCSYKRLLSENNNEQDDLERLEQLSSALDLKDDIKKLVDTFLKSVSDKANILVLCIDDIDLNTSIAVEMIEWIRKYLIQPNILILFALKIDQMVNLKRLQLMKEYEPLLSKRRIKESEVDEMAEKYIAKLIPLANRVYMPGSESLPYVKYKIVGNIQNDLPEYKTEKVLRQVVVEMIFKRTRYLFYNLRHITNQIVPRNLREVLQLLRMLFDMTPIVGNKNGDNHGEGSVLKINQMVFKEYLFGDCLVKHLETKSRQYIEELLVVDSTQFNATVLRLLKQKFAKKLEEYKVKASPFSKSDKRNIEIWYILKSDNIAYNISIGDVLWIVDWLDNMEATDEERYFLFIVRTVYSMRMYEYYYQMVETKKQNEEERVLGRMKDEIKDKSNYHKLLAGQLCNPKLVSMIPGLEKSSVYGELDITKLKEINLTNSDSDTVKLAEFLMLCTSRPYEREKATDDNYRTNNSARYAYSFAPTSKSAVFDLYSLFYNLTDIKACYSRFESVFGEDRLNDLYNNTTNSLWSDLYQGARNRKIEVDNENGNNGNEIGGEEEHQWNIDNDEQKRNWLWWCCLRNAEVYQDLVNYLEANRRKAEKGGINNKIKGFLNSLADYKILTYDGIRDEQYHQIDFGFASTIFEDIQTFDISEYVMISSDVDARIAEILRLIFKGSKSISKKSYAENLGYLLDGHAITYEEHEKYLKRVENVTNDLSSITLNSVINYLMALEKQEEE